MNITIEDLSVADMLESEIEKIKSGLQKGVAKGGEIVKSEAKSLCPVDTGHLRDSISKRAAGNSCDIGTNVEYGIYQEFGTYKMAAHPFLYPALENKVSEVTEAIKESVK